MLFGTEVVVRLAMVGVVSCCHQVFYSFILPADSKRHRVVAIVAMHEDRCGHMLADPELVLDTAAHAQRGVKASSGWNVLLTYDAMPQAACSGLEASVHRTARMEGLAILNFGAVKDFDRIAVRIVQLQQFKDVTLDGFVVRAHAEFYSGRRQLLLHFAEFLWSCHPEAQVHKVVAVVGVQNDTMMPIVHP